MKKNAQEMMGLYKSYLSHKHSGNASDHLTSEGILIETETPLYIRGSAGKEEKE